MRTRESERQRRSSTTHEKPSLDVPERRAVDYVNRSDGQALEPSLRASLEPGLGHSLSRIRIHVDAPAAQMAESLGAAALTVEDHNVFGSGAYDPASTEGQFVIAHELAHAIQNERLGDYGELKARSSEWDSSERDANAVAERVLAGAVANPVAGPGAVISTFHSSWIPQLIAGAVPPGAPPQTTSPARADDPAVETATGAAETGSELMLDHPQSYQDLVDAWNEQVRQNQKLFGSTPGKVRALPEGFGDGLSLLEGTTGIGLGIEKIMNGEYFDGALQTGSGVADAVGGIAGLGGNNRVSNFAGGVSDALSLVGGVRKAFSDDTKEATDGAHTALTSGFDAVSNFAGGPTTSVGAVAAAGGFGARIGKHLVNTSDRFSKERGYFEDDQGRAQSGSSEAADWGQSVDDWFGDDDVVLDKLGSVAGGITAIAGGIANTAYGYGRRGVEAMSDVNNSTQPTAEQKVWLYNAMRG
jgi:hypothetical protein